MPSTYKEFFKAEHATISGSDKAMRAAATRRAAAKWRAYRDGPAETRVRRNPAPRASSGTVKAVVIGVLVLMGLEGLAERQQAAQPPKGG